jgi:uncharacterized protein (DUF433 family)
MSLPPAVRLKMRIAAHWQRNLRDAVLLFAGLQQQRSLVVFDRITFDPKVMGGRACIRGMRITVATVVGQLADGASTEEILAAYPDLEAEDVRQSLAYAAWLTKEEVIPA